MKIEVEASRVRFPERIRDPTLVSNPAGGLFFFSSFLYCAIQGSQKTCHLDIPYLRL